MASLRTNLSVPARRSDSSASPIFAAAVRVGLLSIAICCASCSGEREPAGNRSDTADSVSAAPKARASSATRELPDFAALVEQYGDAVVNVDVLGRARPRGDASASADNPLRDFFRRFGIPVPESSPGAGAPLIRGSGSGFIVSADGYILTNAHVVANADEVTVRLTDRRELPARVIGSDARTDVAVIRVDATNLPTVRIGNQNELRTGEWVLAIGSPFGLDNTATAGIVSATSRAVSGEVDVPFIQTDVAVNPGNSGGPLFNLRGEVVGMNSMIFSQTGGYMGISFAIPIDLAMQIRDQLIKTGRVVRGRIGVAVQDVDAALARSFGLDRPRGALVTMVEPGGPAQKAGLKTGDVIISVNDTPVERSSDVSGAITRLAPGSEATLGIWRAKAERQIKTRVVEAEQPTTRAASRPAGGTDEGAGLGLAVRPLTREEKQQLETEGNVLVAGVTGHAAKAGVQPGDIVLAVNDAPVRSIEELRAAAAKLPRNEPAALLIEREGARVYVAVEVGERSR
jgi:serine protease Do